MSALGPAPLSLFEGFGIELEYMLVDAESLDVKPVCDALLQELAGARVSDFAEGGVGWSNELVLHVVELKTDGPAPQLAGLADTFQAAVNRTCDAAARLGARLLPGGMHPWMDPHAEMRLWPDESNEIYEAYHRIFDCRGHGWANLQSMHINLPFADDAEFRRLHSAIRLVLPLLPALAASSPVAGGRDTGSLDRRLEVYRTNSARIPSVAGAVVPDVSRSQAEYRRDVLERIWNDLAPHDPEGVLRGEFANSRGAIARFDRMAIEIRVLDVQECPRMDIAIAALVTAAVRGLCEGRFATLEEQEALPTDGLARLLWAAAKSGERTLVEDPALLRAFGLRERRATLRDVWNHLRSRLEKPYGLESWERELDLLLEAGPLARRLQRALGRAPGPAELREVYGLLADALAAGRPFVP